MIVGALARNAQDPQQAGALSNALAKDHDGSILDDVTSHLGQAQQADGDGILNHVLGGKRGSVATGLGHVAGLDSGQGGPAAVHAGAARHGGPGEGAARG